jgi:voltage-gated potassium channel
MAQRPSVDADARDDRIERTVDRMIGRRGLRPRSAAYLVIVLWLIAVVAFGVLQRVVDPDSYPTIWPALWWAVQTVTTVGYGDNVPQQAAGKVVASILMIGGLAFLSIVTATITSSFVARRQEHARARGEDPVMQQLAALSEQVQGLEAELRRARVSDDQVPKSP